MSEPNPVDKHQAESIATRVMHDSKPEANFVILSGQTLERDFGWVFFFTTRRYQETQDPGDLVPGAGPIVVLRKTGTATFLPTSVPPPVAIDRFEAQWRAQSRR